MCADGIPVEVLHSPDCGRWRATRDAVVRVAAEHRIPISLRETTVTTQDEVRAQRFPGSPTVRVRGRDLQPEVESLADFGLG